MAIDESEARRIAERDALRAYRDLGEIIWKRYEQ